jgi:Rps23 Pro-64 3,4-dihydroxylase Tpa1-like proline 4-hydroxylase
MNIIKNFLEPENMQNLWNKYEQSKGHPVFEVNDMGRWSPELYQGNFGPVYVLRLNEWFEYFSNKFSQIPIFTQYKLNACFMHIWQRGSGIRWHEDGNGSRIGATVYMNKTWDANYGGLFLYQNDNVNSWYLPEHNDCVWFQSPMWHSVSLLAADAPEPRLSVQLFFDQYE